MRGVVDGGRKGVHTKSSIEFSKATAADGHAASIPRPGEEDEAGANEGEAFGAGEVGEDDGKEDVNPDGGGGGGGGGRGREGGRGGGATETEQGDGIGGVRADGGESVGGRLAG